MVEYKKPYKGRMTIRAGMSDDKRSGRENKRVRAWEFEPKPGTTLAKLETAFLGALSSVDAVIAKRDDSAKSGRFTPEGVNNDVLQFALYDAVPKLKRGRDTVAAAKQEAAVLREKTKLREPDTTDDPWKVGLMLRAVDRFASMTQKQRDALTRNPEALDPITAEALVTAPQSLTGISEIYRQQLVDRALQAQHGEALERAIEAAASAVEMARDEIRLESGIFDPRHQPACGAGRGKDERALVEEIPRGRCGGRSQNRDWRRAENRLGTFGHAGGCRAGGFRG